MNLRALLFVAAAVIATLTGALVGALTLPRSEGGSVRELPPPPSEPRSASSPTGTPDVSGPCDEAEHAGDPECLGASPLDAGTAEDGDENGDDDERGDSSGAGGGGNSGPG